MRRISNKISSLTNLRLTTLIMLGLVVVIGIPSLVKLSLIIRNYSINNQTEVVTQGIRTELGNLSQQAQSVNTLENLRNDLYDRDTIGLLGVLGDEQKKWNLDFLIATDNNGVILGRTDHVTARGDYLFDTTQYGKLMATGRSVTAIDTDKFQPLIMVSGSTLIDSGSILGSVIVGNYIDSSYASEFKEKYLRDDDQIIFFEESTGLVGHSFTDESVDEVLRTNLDVSFSNFQESQFPTDRVVIDHVVYDVQTVLFSDVVRDNLGEGGMLVLVPKPKYINIILFFGLVLQLLLLLTGYVLFNHLSRRIHNREIIQTYIWSLALLGIISLFVVNVLSERRTIVIEKQPYPIYNSVLVLEPETGVFSKRFEQRLSIKIVNGGEPLNAAGAEILFDPELVRIEDIITSNSFCEPGLFVDRTIDNENGRVSVQCGTRTPFTGRTAVIADLLVRPLKDGQFSLKFGQQTSVHAHDGLGTNVLRTTTDGSYVVVTEDVNIDGQSPILVFSSSHPNTERWYNRDTVSFSWRSNDVESYRYAFGKDGTVSPSELNHQTNKTAAEFSLETDGIYRFYLQREKDGRAVGPVSHYWIHVDRTPPEKPHVRVSQAQVKTGEIVRIEFSSSDSESGLQNNYYYVSFNDGIFLPIQPPLFAAFPVRGNHVVTIRAFDNAGNIADSDVTIQVTK